MSVDLRSGFKKYPPGCSGGKCLFVFCQFILKSAFIPVIPKKNSLPVLPVIPEKSYFFLCRQKKFILTIKGKKKKKKKKNFGAELCFIKVLGRKISRIYWKGKILNKKSILNSTFLTGENLDSKFVTEKILDSKFLKKKKI